MSDYNEEDSRNREYQTDEAGGSAAENRSDSQTENGSESPVDGTYRYSYHSSGEDGDEYRRPPYMREDVGGSSNRGPENGSSSDGGRYSYGDEPSGNSQGGRYTYSDERATQEEPRYSYTGGSNGSQTGGGREPRRRGNGPRYVAVIVGALVLGGIIGAACWSIGGRFGGSGVSTAENSAASEAVIETALSEEPQEEAAGEAEETAQEEEAPVETAEAEQSGESVEESESAAEETAVPAGADIASAGSSEGSQIVAMDVSDVVDLTMPTVVAITTTTLYEYYNNYGGSPFDYWYYGGGNGSGGSSTYEVTGAGSGIIIGDDGEELWIVTNNHVVADSDSLNVTFCDDATVEAYIKGTDANNDLAVVGVKLSDLSKETRSSIKAIEMGDSDSLRLGETVIAIGNALGLGQSVSTGVVSAMNREITVDNLTLTTIQTDAAINPGNSGGALLNSQGQLIGINVAKDTEEDVEGMGFAIPISSARSIIDNLTSMTPREAVNDDDFPYIGVSLTSVDSTMQDYYGMPAGVLVYSIEENTPAEEAGLLEYDIITSFEGVTVTTYDELYAELQYYAGGTEVTLTIQRLDNGAYVEKEIKLTLGRKADYPTATEESTEAEDSGSDGGFYSNPFWGW